VREDELFDNDRAYCGIQAACMRENELSDNGRAYGRAGAACMLEKTLPDNVWNGLAFEFIFT
jgi:hypothetical protein